MNIFKLTAAIVISFGLSACAHNISISPNTDKLSANKSAAKIDKNIGYYISNELLAKQVTTPGGGGDDVSYTPYRDVETGFFIVLSNVFSNVVKLKSSDDSEGIGKNSLKLLISPSLVTNSSSPSPFTWPPTKFETQLTCRVTDITGNVIYEAKVTGSGAAEFDEFKKDFSLSARRSTEDALLKLQTALINAEELRK